jgi:hypothetical protein
MLRVFFSIFLLTSSLFAKYDYKEAYNKAGKELGGWTNRSRMVTLATDIDLIVMPKIKFEIRFKVVGFLGDNLILEYQSNGRYTYYVGIFNDGKSELEFEKEKDVDVVGQVQGIKNIDFAGEIFVIYFNILGIKKAN